MSYAHAIDSYYDDLIPATAPFQIDWRLVVALLGVVTLGAAVVFGTPPAVEAYRGHQAAQVEAEAAGPGTVTPDLPREWRWEPQGVQYEHMFAK